MFNVSWLFFAGLLASSRVQGLSLPFRDIDPDAQDPLDDSSAPFPMNATETEHFKVDLNYCITCLKRFTKFVTHQITLVAMVTLHELRVLLGWIR